MPCNILPFNYQSLADMGEMPTLVISILMVRYYFRLIMARIFSEIGNLDPLDFANL